MADGLRGLKAMYCEFLRARPKIISSEVNDRARLLRSPARHDADTNSQQLCPGGKPASRLAALARPVALVGAIASVAVTGCSKRTTTVGPAVDASPMSAAPGHGKWDWTGIIGTGQSLSVGVQGEPVILAHQPFGNLKLSLGDANLGLPPYPSGDSRLALVPLVEPIRPETTAYPSAYPFNIWGESPHTAMGDEISALSLQSGHGDYVTIHTVVGESGQGLSVIEKGATALPDRGHAFAASLFEVAAVARIAAAAGKIYGVGAVILTHGETDAMSPSYEQGLARLYDDYNAGILAITHQEQAVPLFLTQQQTTPGIPGRALSPIAQWKAGIDRPGAIVCVGPKYQYPYAADALHLTADGYDRLGEKYGEAYYEQVVLGHRWQPLEPVAATRSGKTVVLTFHAPYPPLAWDDALPSPHGTAHAAWAKGRGFEVEDRDGEQTIASVAIRGPAVEIELASEPSAEGLVVRYATTQDGDGQQAGRAAGRIGQLRDSDPRVGYATKQPQYDYAVAFEVPVPWTLSSR
jgi:hypothetical protein